jgi:hypothetical protein
MQQQELKMKREVGQKFHATRQALPDFDILERPSKQD